MILFDCLLGEGVVLLVSCTLFGLSGAGVWFECFRLRVVLFGVCFMWFVSCLVAGRDSVTLVCFGVRLFVALVCCRLVEFAILSAFLYLCLGVIGIGSL